MIAIADTLYPELKDALTKLDTLAFLPKSKFLYDGVGNHPDLQMGCLGGRLFLSEEWPHLITSLSPSYDIQLLAPPGNRYPASAKFNFLATATHLLCNTHCLAPEILAYALTLNLEPIHCNQGYVRCTTFAVADDCFITDDPGIYKTLCGHSLETLLVKRGAVKLEGYDHGFIGGCVGLVGETLYVNGDLACHPDGARIRAVCSTKGLTIVDVPGSPLVDVGGILAFDVPLFPGKPSKR